MVGEGRVIRRNTALVGRDDELGFLVAALDVAISGRGQVRLVSGDPGAGKTSLVRAVADEASRRGAIVAWGRSWDENAAPAFWPWIQVVRALVEQLTPRELEPIRTVLATIGSIVPGLRAETAASATESGARETRFAVFDAMGTLFKHAAATSPLVVVLDDLHFADESSLHLLSFLARELDRQPVLIVGTYADAEATRDPLRSRALQSVIKEGEVLRLRGLSKDDVATLYEERAGQAPEEQVLAMVYEATEGNPFFVEETIRFVGSRGDIRRPDHSLGFRVPKGARSALEDRLAPLSDDVIWTLSIGAVIGREFEIETLQAVAQTDVSALLDMLNHAVIAGIIEEIGSQGRYSFTHVLMREAMYERLTAAERMRLHSEIAETIETHFEDDLDPHLDALAHHYFKAAQAGNRNKAVDYLRRAARNALHATAYEESARLLRRALQVAETGALGKATRDEMRAALQEVEQRAGSDRPPAEGARPKSHGVFARRGEYWEIEFEGRRFRLRDSKGLRYISQMLRHPGRELHSLEIVALVEGGARAGRGPVLELRSDGPGDAGEVLDAAAKAAYKRRIQELQDDIDEAALFNDAEREARARAEMEAVLQQLAGGVGLGGRDRRAASTAERARVSVTKAVKGTLAKVSGNHPALAAHLKATIRTGIYCSYNPDPRFPQEWEH